MSLINDVLKDLERRGESSPAAASRSLRPPRRGPRPWVPATWILVAVLTGVILHWTRSVDESVAILETPLQASVHPPATDAPTEQNLTRVIPESTGNEASAPNSNRAVAIARTEPDPAGKTLVEPEAAATPEDIQLTNPPVRQVVSTSTQSPHQQPAAARQDAPEPGNDANSAISIHRASAETETEPRPEHDLESIRRSLARGQHGVAERRLRHLLDDRPGHDEARMMLARLLVNRRQERDAVEVLEEGLEHAGSADLARMLGRLLVERGESLRASRVLSEHVPDPLRDPDYHQLLAAAYRQSDNHEAALETYTTLSRIVPGRGAVWVGLGATLESLERPIDARTAYLRALDGNDPRAIRFAQSRLDVLPGTHGDRR